MITPEKLNEPEATFSPGRTGSSMKRPEKNCPCPIPMSPLVTMPPCECNDFAEDGIVHSTVNCMDVHNNSRFLENFCLSHLSKYYMR